MMDSVNVMVTSSLGDENLSRIAAVSPRVNLMDASVLWNAPDMLPDDKRTSDFSSEEFDSMLAQAEVIYGFRTPNNIIARAPQLKWIQVMLAGVDHFLTDDIQLLSFRVTCFRSVELDRHICNIFDLLGFVLWIKLV